MHKILPVVIAGVLVVIGLVVTLWHLKLHTEAEIGSGIGLLLFIATAVVIMVGLQDET